MEAKFKSRQKIYNFPLEPIPRIDINDPRVDEIISEQKPVVITDSQLVDSASHWDLDYLEKHLGLDTVSVNISDKNVFKYYDEDKAKTKGVDFKPPFKQVEMSSHEFGQLMRMWRPGNKNIYLQQLLNDKVGRDIVIDFLKFNWPWVTKQQQQNNWGSLTSNLLLVSSEGNISPAHYDEQENFFAQIHGHKRFILFSPDQFDCLYPYPIWHPHDRQSQVDFDDPDLETFPKFSEVHGLEATLGPGDVLFLPSYYWHHVESLAPGYTVSINFWYKAKEMEMSHPLPATHKMVIARNLEKIVFEIVQDATEVGPLLKAMVLGRY